MISNLVSYMGANIAILTSGGDAPGMNALLNSVVRNAILAGLKPYFVLEGYKGLVQGHFREASPSETFLHQNSGGTFIFSQRFQDFKEERVRKIAVAKLAEYNIDSLIVAGGDGSFKGALALHQLGIKTIAIPTTIDNNIPSTEFTIGFDTALETISKAIESLTETAASHKRCMIVEVMGWGWGDLALFSAMATGADIVVTNEAPLSEEEIIETVSKLRAKEEKQKVLIVISEKIFASVHELAKKVEEKSGFQTRAVVLGHLQRGGRPSATDKIRAYLFGKKAVELLKEGKSGVALGIKNDWEVVATPIVEALQLKDNRDKKRWAQELNKANQV